MTLKTTQGEKRIMEAVSEISKSISNNTVSIQGILGMRQAVEGIEKHTDKLAVNFESSQANQLLALNKFVDGILGIVRTGVYAFLFISMLYVLGTLGGKFYLKGFGSEVNYNSSGEK